MRENLAAFNRWIINGDFMSGNGAADTTTTILGVNISYPAITAPIGNQGSVHVRKELPNVKGTAAAGTLICASSVSQMSAEDIVAASDGPKWFQLYIPRDRGFAKEMLQRAKEAGYKALIVTADLDVTSNRERSITAAGHSLAEFKHGQRSQDARR
jgi:L-lactate oxidase